MIIDIFKREGFFNVKGRRVGKKLSETFTEVMVRWYLKKKLFSLTLDNASANEVVVDDIISDMKENGHASLVWDGIFYFKCAYHILNLVARDGMKVISKTIDKIKAFVVVVRGFPLQREELMKCVASESGLDNKKGISLDLSTRWNSTYLMSHDAFYKEAFVSIKSSKRRRYENICPSLVE